MYSSLEEEYVKAFGREDWAKMIYNVPVDNRRELLNYLMYGQPPGDFIGAIVSNDLMGAMRGADSFNITRLFDYCNFLYNFAPGESYGSVAKRDEWIKAQRTVQANEDEC